MPTLAHKIASKSEQCFWSYRKLSLKVTGTKK